MIELACWGCGWDGRTQEEFAGLRVRCRRCGVVNAVPEPVTREVDVADLLAVIDAGWTDPRAESPTAEIECLPPV